MATINLVPKKAVACLNEKESIRVLHVDDEASFLKKTKECLETERPFKVNTASSVNEALKKMKKEEYDAVVCDYQMPGKDGLEFLKQLRKRGNDIPFIILTGKGREEIAIKALNLGADRYLSKTGDPETVFCELAHAIRQAVDRRQAHIELSNREAKFRAVLESSPEAIIVTDLNGNIVECNQATADLHSDQSKEDLIGANALEVIAKKDREKAIQNLKKTIEQGPVKAVEYTLLTKDGHEFPGELSASVVRDASGKPEYLVAITRDITERKKTERELLIKDNAIASSIDGMAISDLQGNITYVNPVFVKMWGYNSDKEVLGKSITEMTRKGQSKEKADEIVKTLRTKGGWTSEIAATRKDGSRFYAILSASLVKDKAGKPICMLVSFVDVTDRKKGEEALKESEERLKQLIEYAPDAIYTNDLHGNFLEGNKQAENLTGFKKEELVGKNILEAGILPEKYAQKVMQDLMKNMQGQRTGPDEYELMRKDGTSVTAEISTFPIRREGRVEVIGIARDITDRKKAEQALKYSEEKYRSLVELAPDGIAAVNTEGIVTSTNRSFLKLIGYDSEEEIVGKPFTELKSSRVEDIPKFQSMFTSLMKGESPSPVEFLYVRRDGTNRWAEVHPGLLVKDGKPAGAQVIMIDISERKQMEQKLEEYSQQLEEMVEYRTKQLRDTQIRLVKSERLAAIGQVAAMVGHDLRNPLTGIMGAAYYLKMKLGPNAEKKMLEMLEIIEKDIHYSNNIITDLMDYSRETRLELTETTPKSIIAESISLIQIPEKVQLADSTLNEPKIKIDIVKMKRVFADLIKNAVDAMPQGGKLTISSRASSNNVEFMLIDSGVGMAKEVLEKIWTPFFTTKAKGLGLGLAICKRIIEAHQGKISVESIVGEGTIFTITIPIEPIIRVEGGEKVWANISESLLSTTTKA
jgi:two-component system sporulation sensor kinase A